MSVSEDQELKRQGNVYFAQKEYQQALEKFTLAIAVAPEEAQAVLYSNRSAAYAQLEDFKNALADGKRAVELKPKWAKGHNRVAMALFGLNRLPQAAVEKKYEGNIYFADKAYKEAIVAFSEGIEMDKNNHVLYSNRSAAYLSVRSYQLALNDAKQAITITPSFTKAHRRAISASLSLGSFDEAEQFIDSGVGVVSAPDQLTSMRAEIEGARAQAGKNIVSLFGADLLQGPYTHLDIYVIFN